MKATLSVTTDKTKSRFRAILTAGMIAGAMDITAAMLTYSIREGASPVNVLYFVASGVFGTAAFAGGWGMAMSGLLFHFLIALAFAAFYFWLYPKLPVLDRNRIVAGIAYGLAVWLVMNLIVLPLSNVPELPFRPTQAMIGIGIIMLCVGLPVAFVADRFFSTTKPVSR